METKGNTSMPMAPSHANESPVAMHMSFFWGKDVVLLFDGWPGTCPFMMYILALATVLLLAIADEIVSEAMRLKPRGVNPIVGAAIHAAVHSVRMALAYLVMLSVMSYNVGVFLAAVAGHAVGRFVVTFIAAVDS